ncbi:MULTISPECIES: NUDIX domain-containing protein [unclassified Roseibium]|uniref:NUDIX domain-containing protein n=1 Tax=unclassified Roseibium TaxID=2629323 RepID=UPI00273F0C88|nr:MULTISPECIES: NUDIX domain-containing protein [unclassified Roseibium]
MSAPAKETDFLKILNEELLSDNWGKVTKYTLDYRRRDGTWQRQTREVYDRGHGAACLLHNPETGCVLLTRQFRLPVWLTDGSATFIEAPAGLLEGAHPEERMRAELMEETGFEVSELEHLFDLQMSPGSITEVLSYFRGCYQERHRTGEGGGAESEGEDIEVLHIPLEEALQMVSDGRIRDAKTVILLQDLELRELRAAKD